MLPLERKSGRGGDYVSGGGISLEMAEVVSDDLLDVDAGRMVDKDRGNPITVAGGRRGVEGGSAEGSSDKVEGAGDNGVGESSAEEEGG
eukprot:g24737.t1